MSIGSLPEHAADATPQLIPPSDDAWDKEAIDAQRKLVAAEAKKADRKPEPHPYDVYQAGTTRYDLAAPITYAGRAVLVTEYLREGATPTVVELRRVGGKAWRAASSVIGSGDMVRVSGLLWDLTQKGVAHIREGLDDSDRARWGLDGGDAGRPLTGDDMERLFNLDAGLVTSIGWAVFNASAPLSEREGKR